MPTFDCIVYSHNENGLIAAMNAKARGLNVCLLAGHDAFGGMLTNGLLGADGTSGLKGIAWEYFQRVGAKYGLTSSACGAPSMNKLVLEEMLAYYGLTVTQGDIASVTTTGGRVSRVVTTLGTNLDLTANGVCIDSSYGGDLLVKAGCPTVYGRQAQSSLEPSAGWGVISTEQTKPPYRGDGSLMKGVLPYPEGKRTGQADDGIQGINFRTVLQAIATGGTPFTQPPDYDPLNYEWYNAVQKASGDYNPPITKTYADSGGSPNLPPFYDSNIFDIPHTGLDKLAWVTGTPAERAAQTTRARNWARGYWYFFANDPSVWAPRREWFASMGLATNEFTDNGNWPYQLYVRLSRQLVALYVMTQADCQITPFKDDAIARGRLSLDQHVHNIYANAPGGRANGAVYEGKMGSISIEAKIYSDANGRGYQIPYRSIVPASGPRNVLGGGFVNGATSVAAGSIRGTGTTMEIAQAAGIAAWIAVTTGKALSRIGDDVAAEVAKLA